MAVSIADLTATSVGGDAVTTLTTPALTITSNSNRAGLLGLTVNNNAITAPSGSLGGVSGSAISGTDSTNAQVCRSLQFQVIAPPSGSQTATMSWTTAVNCVLGAATTSGVDQTTPFNNGTFASGGAGTTTSVSITSTNGDLTIDTLALNDSTSVGPTSPLQTQEWNNSNAAITHFGAGSIGPGTGTATHGWTKPGSKFWAESGANFVQAAAGGETTKIWVYV